MDKEYYVLKTKEPDFLQENLKEILINRIPYYMCHQEILKIVLVYEVEMVYFIDLLFFSGDI